MYLRRDIELPLRRSSVVTAILLSLAGMSGEAQAQKIDPAAYLRAAEYRQKMQPAKPKHATRGTNVAYSDISWEFFGPYNLQPRYVAGQGPSTSFMSGRVNGVAFDNRTQGIFYVAAASGGVWKADATTGTIVWTPLGDKFPFMETSSVATDPTNGRILYVGLGDFYGFGSGQGEGLDTPRFSGNGTALGIMKSVNGGTTFVNIGNRDSAGNAIMAGSAVSAIVVYPKDPRVIVASTGRGPNPGSLWRSTDGGATWTRPVLRGTTTPVPAGDWNTVRVFNPYDRPYPNYPAKTPAILDPTSPFMYASRINDGIYRSDDRGATWRRIANTPLNFNLAAATGRKTLLVTPSATDPFVVYFMDTTSSSDDGRIFRGQPLNRSDVNGTGALNYIWTEITGNYNIANGQFNNWSRSEYASSLLAAPSMFSVPQPPPASFTGTTASLDVLYGGNRSLSASRGADIFFTLNLLKDTVLWRDIAFSYTGPPNDRIQAWQRDIKYDPFDPVNILVANDGGVYSFRHDLGTAWVPTTNLNTSGDIGGSTPADIRRQSFGVTQINGADFSPTNPDYAVAGTQHMGAVRFPAATTGWVNVGATAQDFSSGPGTNQPSMVGQYVGNTAIMGSREFAWVISGGNGQRLVMTTGGWAPFTVRDISPDQSFTGTNASSGASETHFPYPYRTAPDTGSTDTSIQAAFAGQTKSQNPVLTADVGNNLLYTGTNALWWFSPTGNESGADGTTTFTQTAGAGRWKMVGTTTFGGVITAISVTRGPENPNPFNQAGQRVYIGTSTGEVWMTGDNARDLQNPPPTTGPNPSVATWRQINNGTLPGRPVTSISVNPARPEDILVTLGGVGGGHVYRCQNTRSSTIVYTDQSGLITDSTDPNPPFTRLPDIPVNGLARDATDPTQTWYIATDMGVFVTTDQGSTWQDATTPLGLPNVQCTAIKYVTQGADGFLNVATYGRGLWRLKTTAAQQVYATPNLTSSFTLNRIGNQIFAVITVANVQRRDAQGNKVATGLAENVRIISSSIIARTTALTSTTLPVTLGAIAPGTSRSITLRFPGTVGASGSAATFRLAGTYITQTLSGPSAPTATNFSDVRTRLP